MKRIKLIPINEPDMMVPNALEIIRGGVVISCRSDSCSNNSGNCDENYCTNNQKDCSINKCNGNYLPTICTDKGYACLCKGQACLGNMEPVNP